MACAASPTSTARLFSTRASSRVGLSSCRAAPSALQASAMIGMREEALRPRHQRRRDLDAAASIFRLGMTRCRAMSRSHRVVQHAHGVRLEAPVSSTRFHRWPRNYSGRRDQDPGIRRRSTSCVLGEVTERRVEHCRPGTIGAVTRSAPAGFRPPFSSAARGSAPMAASLVTISRRPRGPRRPARGSRRGKSPQ